jgi:predicted RNA polymerase sigma factor
MKRLRKRRWRIARAFLVTPATLAQRIVRAKALIRDKAIPYQVPVSQELSARLRSRGFVSSMTFWLARNSPTIPSRTPPVRICVAG